MRKNTAKRFLFFSFFSQRVAVHTPKTFIMQQTGRELDQFLAVPYLSLGASWCWSYQWGHILPLMAVLFQYWLADATALIDLWTFCMLQPTAGLLSSPDILRLQLQIERSLEVVQKRTSCLQACTAHTRTMRLINDYHYTVGTTYSNPGELNLKFIQ